MDEERLIVALEARIRDFERNMQKAERKGTQSYQRLRTGSRTATTAMERDMTRASGRINQALAATSSRIGAFGKAFAAGAVTAGIAAITTGATRAIRSMAEIEQQANRAGLSVQAFQELKYVSEQSRIDVDAMIDGLKELQLRADEFVVTGKGSGADAFRRLGYDARDLARRLEEPEELFLDIVDRLEDMDRAAQIRIADEVFGGTGGERFVELLAEGDEGIRDMMTRANELGLVMDSEAIAKAAELDRKFAEITQRVATLAKTVTVNLAGSIEDALTIDVDDIFGSAERAIAMMGEENYRALKDAKGITEEQIDTVEDLQDTYEGLFRAINSATGPDGIRLMDVADVEEAHALAAILQDIEAEMSAFKTGETSASEFEASVADAVEEAQGLLTQLSNVDAQRFGNVISAVDAIATALTTATRKAAELRANMPEGDTETAVTYGPQNGRPRYTSPGTDLAPRASPRPQLPSVNHSFGVPDPEPTRSGGSGGGSSSSDFEAEIDRTRERIALLEAESVALVAVAESGREYGDAVEYARKRAELLVAAKREGREITPELRAEIDQLAQAYTMAGVNAEEAADRLERMQEAAEGGIDRMTDLFFSIVDGSMTAREAVAQLLVEIAKVQMRQQLMNAASAVPGGGIFATFGKLLGFAGGGYTGDGGRTEPAGVVHRGEYVVRASEVEKPGVRQLLDAINDGMPGFARGGYVSGPMPSPSLPYQVSGSSTQKVVVENKTEIINNAKGVSVQEETEERADGSRLQRFVLSDMVAKGMSTQGGAGQTMLKNGGLRTPRPRR